ELSDEYFLSLGAYKDFSQTASYSDGVGAKALNVYRILGFLVFYGAQYGVRPWRIVRVLMNLAQNKQESRLDKSIQDLARRLRNRRQTEGPDIKQARAAN
ncbi:MAG: hypothetical protein AB7P22_15575, partial [Vicinamibacterales bacterium]